MGMDTSTRAAEDTPRKETLPQEGWPGYDVVEAAGSYSNITGLVAGFALTAVVLIFTVAATADLDPAQRLDLGFATTLFTISFVGCLLCAYAFAALEGERSSVATLTYSMLIGSGLSVCIVATLGGFEALAHAFLPESSLVFLIVCAVAATVAPPFVWFPQWDIVQSFGPPTYFGPPQSREEAKSLVWRLFAVGALAAASGVAVQRAGLLGRPESWEYLVVTLVGLIYTMAMVLAAIWVSTQTHRLRLTTRRTWVLAVVQSTTIFVMIALLP